MIVSAGVYQYIYMYREKSLLLQEQVIDIWYRLTTLISKVHRLVWSSLCCYFWNIWLNIRTIFWIIENNDFSQESARHFVSSLWAVSVFFCLFGFIVSYIMAHSCEQILEIKQKRLIANNVRLDSSTWNKLKETSRHSHLTDDWTLINWPKFTNMIIETSWIVVILWWIFYP